MSERNSNSLSSMKCFECKQFGHLRKDCVNQKEKVESPKNKVKICFNCGEHNHLAKNCSKDIKSNKESTVDIDKLTKKLTISYKKLLYVDALNFGRTFFPGNIWNLNKAFKSIEKFVLAAQRSGYQLKVFIDQSANSNEAQEKWRSRRENELLKGRRAVPTSISIFLGEIFRRFDIEVFYSLEADNDDTIAFFAHADGADILSQDGDFFRYQGANYKVWADFDRFELRKGKLVLKEHSPTKIKKSLSTIQKRLIGKPPGTCSKNDFPWVSAVINSKYYIRGVPSALVRSIGLNPHSVVAPLRHALFMGLFPENTEIHEEYPIWNATMNCVEWYSKQINISLNSIENFEYFDELLLQDPKIVFKIFFPNEAINKKPPGLKCSSTDWLNHCFACRCLVTELCCAATGQELLGQMMA